MKLTRSFILIFLLISSIKLQAQVELGLHGGISRSSFHGDRLDLDGLKPVPSLGYHASIDFLYSIRSDIFLGLSPTYHHIGMKLQTLDTVFEISPFSTGGQSVVIKTELKDSVNVRIDYLGIPVSLHVISDNGKFQFNTGIMVGFPVRNEFDNGESKEDIKYLKEINISANFAIGYRIPLNKKHLSINIFYSQGLINIVKKKDELEDYQKRLKTVDFGVSLGYIIVKSDGKDKNSD